METPAEAAATDPSARTFSQVVFTDISRSYPPSTAVTCSYTLAASFQPKARDWVGIFKVGWSTTKDYHTFVWVEPCVDVEGQQSVIRQAVFKDYYLPKDEIEFYQFCYIDSAGQVRGASTPFCFRNPAEQSMESSPDDDLLVITTQEQVDQSVREKAELQRELLQITEEKESLKRALEKEQQEAACLKSQDEQKEKERSQLVRELLQTKEENENLKGALKHQQEELDHLKEEMLTKRTEQVEVQRESAAEHEKEKYDRAVMKIKQLKEEREELRRRVDARSDEISSLNSKIREAERELFRMKDSVQLLQVDLQSSEKEKEKLSAEVQRLQGLMHNMDDVKRENQELCRRLSQQETPHSSPDDELKVQRQTLVCQLQEELAAEREASRNSKRKAEVLDRELLHVREQLEKMIGSHEQAERKSNKQELQLREAHEVIADKDSIIEDKEHLIMLLTNEKEELAKENKTLFSDIEGLRRVCADLQAAAPRMQPDSAPPAGAASSTCETPEQTENLYETIGSAAGPEEEPSLVCRHCQESFPFITRLELEQHEQSHRVCPFCTLICDGMEQSEFEDHVYSH
ncbi:calcium-binding and coiled-coil domain-containing protein 2 [Chaetodon trifascialis]|uniref:calcium-binding and coiled-coil domain-containing protein 2 n=1 Tax=Chaetodon trifascialis TaxID=109706 RepID=UPI00399536AC